VNIFDYLPIIIFTEKQEKVHLNVQIDDDIDDSDEDQLLDSSDESWYDEFYDDAQTVKIDASIGTYTYYDLTDENLSFLAKILRSR